MIRISQDWLIIQMEFKSVSVIMGKTADRTRLVRGLILGTQQAGDCTQETISKHNDSNRRRCRFPTTISLKDLATIGMVPCPSRQFKHLGTRVTPNQNTAARGLPPLVFIMKPSSFLKVLNLFLQSPACKYVLLHSSTSLGKKLKRVSNPQRPHLIALTLLFLKRYWRRGVFTATGLPRVFFFFFFINHCFLKTQKMYFNSISFLCGAGWEWQQYPVNWIRSKLQQAPLWGVWP